MRRAAFVLALLAVLALPVGTAVASFGAVPVASGSAASPNLAGSDSSGAGFSSVSSALQTQQADEWRGETEIVVSLQSDRDAKWHVITRYSLATENQTAAFRRYADAFEAGQVSGGVGADTFRRIANASAETAGRPMTVRNVSRSARVEGDTGVLVLSFTWTNFLEEDPDSDLLVLQDAFMLPGDRTWLATLQPDQRLVIQTPSGYALNYSSVPVQPVSGSVVIDGPRDFSEDEPLTIRYQPTTAADRLPWELVIGSLVALIVVALVVLRRRGELGGAGGGPLSGAGPSGGDESELTGEEPGEPAADASESVTSAGAESPPGEVEREPPAEETAEVDLTLLSDEERVEHLLEQRGGRMRQAKIVEETGWSDAKVSQLLSAMDEEGRIEKLRIGRENLISLPEADAINGTANGADADDTDTGDTGADESGPGDER